MIFIKPFPKDARFKAVRFMDGMEGYASQEYYNEEYGVTVLKERQNRYSPWVTKVFIARVQKTFNSLEECRDWMLANEGMH